MAIKCLNPIVCYDKNYYKFKTDLMRKRELKGFFNLNKLIEKYGNDEARNFISSPDVILLPCRKCSECQKQRAREWSIRNCLEAQGYDDGECWFITFTYDISSLPVKYIQVNDDNNCISDKSNKRIVKVSQLWYPDFQSFMKRLRKKFSNFELRFFMCGEYGSKTFRPHYHLLLYGLPGYAIGDLEYDYTSEGFNFYHSDTFTDLWGKGIVMISNFSPYTASYVAGYVIKKEPVDSSSNYCFANNKLYQNIINMSRRPGIGSKYLNEHYKEIYDKENGIDEFFFHFNDTTIPLKPLHYFDRLFDKIAPSDLYYFKQHRKKFLHNEDYFDDLETNMKVNEYNKVLNELNYKKSNKRKEI